MFMLRNPEDYTILSLHIPDTDIDAEHWDYFSDTDDDDGVNELGANINGDTSGGEDRDDVGNTDGGVGGKGTSVFMTCSCASQHCTWPHQTPWTV